MKTITLLTILCWLSLPLSAQTSNQNRMHWWQFGDQNELQFSGPGGSPIVGTSAMEIGPAASISSTNGDLIMYTNNYNLWDANDNLVSNALGFTTPFAQMQHFTQTLIVKKPCDDLTYYIFSTPHSFVANPTHPTDLVYTEVSADPNGVSIVQPNQVLQTDFCTEKLTAIAHENGRDIWLIAYDYGAEQFHSYLVDANGVANNPVPSPSPILLGGDVWNNKWDMKVSPTTNRLAMLSQEHGIQLCEFDPQTGLVGNCQACDPLDNSQYQIYRGLEFSPSGRFLYYSGFYNDLNQGQAHLLSRLDLNSQDICASNEIFFTTNGFEIKSIQRGPDDVLYVGTTDELISGNPNHHFLGIINNPDNLAPPTFNSTAIPTQDPASSLPNFMQSYFDPDYVEQLSSTQAPNIVSTVISSCGECANTLEIEVHATCAHDTYEIVLTNPANQTAIGSAQGTIATFNNLCSGNYEILVYSENFGSLLQSELVTVSSAASFFINPTIVHASCFCDGMLSVTPTAGMPPFQYTLNGAPFNGTATNLCPGWYDVEIEDAEGCSIGASFEIKEENLQVDAKRIAICGEDCGWGIAATPLNGTAPFVYEIDGITQPAGQSIFGPLCGGQVLTITDAIGCQNSTTVAAVPESSIITGPEVLCVSTASQGSFPVETYELCFPPGFSLLGFSAQNGVIQNAGPTSIDVSWYAVSGTHSLTIAFTGPNIEQCKGFLDISLDPNCRRSQSNFNANLAPEILPLSLKAFPNPTDGQLIIQLAGEQTGNIQAKLLTVSGQSVQSWTSDKSSLLFQEKISLQAYPTGMYVLEVQLGSKTFHQKIFKR
ncbi:MAG: T9SS type A sorting domain-containing protein [Bacteroidota bacterium]